MTTRCWPNMCGCASPVLAAVGLLAGFPHAADARPRPPGARAVHATGDVWPNDPGVTGPGGWQTIQWNLLDDAGIDAPGAWAEASARQRPGGVGVRVAVLDSGVSRNPDLDQARVRAGH